MHQLPPAQPGMQETEIETPALIIDLDAFEFNLDTMARRVAATSARLRPHAKTHKSPVVAQLQRRRGAIGQCVQKVAEAEAMAGGGVDDLLVTNQVVDPRKLAVKLTLSEPLGPEARAALVDALNLWPANGEAGAAGAFRARGRRAEGAREVEAGAQVLPLIAVEVPRPGVD